MQDQSALLQRDITDQVSDRLEGLEKAGLALPAHYNPQNALKSAWFAILKTQDRNKQPALNVVTKESVANALLDMLVQGLSPAKSQAYFIVYGRELQLQRSYFGTQTVLKRLADIDDVWAEVVHKGDKFQIGSDRGRTVVTKFEPAFENIDNEIIAAFAIVKRADDELLYTVMSAKQIQASWSKTKNGGSTQKQFPEEMAKRTVINRAAKNIINTSDDSDLYVDALNRTTHGEYDDEQQPRDVTPESGEDMLQRLLDAKQTQQLPTGQTVQHTAQIQKEVVNNDADANETSDAEATESSDSDESTAAEAQQTELL